MQTDRKAGKEEVRERYTERERDRQTEKERHIQQDIETDRQKGWLQLCRERWKLEEKKRRESPTPCLT